MILSILKVQLVANSTFKLFERLGSSCRIHQWWEQDKHEYSTIFYREAPAGVSRVGLQCASKGTEGGKKRYGDVNI